MTAATDIHRIAEVLLPERPGRPAFSIFSFDMSSSDTKKDLQKLIHTNIRQLAALSFAKNALFLRF
jgi:hypothetical protein